MQTQTRHLHMNMTVGFFAGLLRDMERRGEPQDYVKSDDGEYASFAEAQTYLDQLRSDGVHVLPVGECNNFDPIKGCLGHEKE